MEKNNLKGKKYNSNEQFNQNMIKKGKNFIFKFPLELNSYSEDDYSKIFVLITII